MRNTYDLHDQPVGQSYQYLIQYREDKLFTGDGEVFTVGNYVQIVQEEFELDSEVSYIFTLQNTPNTSKPIQLTWNGMRLRQGIENDYVIVGDILQINVEHSLAEGDVFQVVYHIY